MQCEYGLHSQTRLAKSFPTTPKISNFYHGKAPGCQSGRSSQILENLNHVSRTTVEVWHENKQLFQQQFWETSRGQNGVLGGVVGKLSSSCFRLYNQPSQCMLIFEAPPSKTICAIFGPCRAVRSPMVLYLAGQIQFPMQSVLFTWRRGQSSSM